MARSDTPALAGGDCLSEQARKWTKSMRRRERFCEVKPRPQHPDSTPTQTLGHDGRARPGVVVPYLWEPFLRLARTLMEDMNVHSPNQKAPVLAPGGIWGRKPISSDGTTYLVLTTTNQKATTSHQQTSPEEPSPSPVGGSNPTTGRRLLRLCHRHRHG